MLGGWEIVILVLIVALFFGYKRLPQIGRSAGEGARQLKESAQSQAAKARDYAEERGPEAKAYLEEKGTKAKEYVSERTPTAKEIGRTTGKQVREYRELKEEIMSSPVKEEPKPPDES